MRACLTLIAVLALSFHGSTLAQQTPGASDGTTAIVAGALFDGTGEALTRNVTILVRDGRIAEVGTNVNVPANARRIDLSEWTVMPGFIDLHTHMGPMILPRLRARSSIRNIRNMRH